MPVDYQVFDPSSCCFPRPRVPVLPYGFESTLGYHREANPATSLQAENGVYFSRGRYALGAAYRLAGLDSSSTLLAPAFHCVTMIDPALSLGADVLFYSLTPDLAPDLTALDDLVERSTKPVKVFLATHYFGFVHDFSRLKQWSNARGIRFVEDCSHTLFAENYQAEGAGLYGDYVVSSPYKFFPCPDGGWLYSENPAALAGVAVQHANWLSELRGIKHCFDAVGQPRVGLNDIASFDSDLALLDRQPLEAGVDQGYTRQAQSARYENCRIDMSALRTSRWLIRHSAIGPIVRKREANYRRWLDAVADLPNCHPLYPELPAQVVPYMFPLYIDHPMPHFYRLKLLGVPVWRWDERAISDCQVARDYRLHLLHLPCHQSLSDNEMNWLVAAITKILRSSVAGALQ